MDGATAQSAQVSLTSQNGLEKVGWKLRHRTDDRQGQIHSSEISLTHAKLQRNRIANRAAPISKLPNEILAAIFEAGYSTPFPEPNDISDIRFEILVSHVTYAWRETAISLARMWTKIHIRVGNPLEQLEGRSTTYLSRSKTMPFDLHIDLGAIISPPTTNISFVCQAITSHVDRCQNLLIRSNWRHSLYQLAEQLLHRLPAAPLLRNLYIRLEPNHLDTANVSASGDILAILQGGAPRLASVRVAGIPLNYCLPPMSAVTSLHIHEPIYGSSDSCSTTRNILNDLPALTELVLHGWILNDDGLDSVRLPALRSLKITTTDDFEYILVPLKVISAPLLEDLYIGADTSALDFFEDWDLPWDHTTTESRFPLLHSLVLDGCLIPPAICDAPGSAFPAITELTVLGMNLTDVLRQSAWPNLQILSFDTFPVDLHAANSLARALAMRLAIGKPINTLRSTEPLQLPQGLVAVEELWTPTATDMADWRLE
jgi:hypothetical protein